MPANLRSDLVRLMSDGELHSGEALARNLRCTRTAVWKQLSKLRSMGLPIETSRGRGYRIARPIELLDRDLLLRHMDTATAEHLENVALYGVTDSTSERLRLSPSPLAGNLRVALAEYQTGGRGRRGRQWFSPYAGGLCMSVSWCYDEAPPALSGLSLAAGVAVLRAMERWRPEGLGLKWPNDLVADGRKLAGLLVDMEGEATGPIKIIIGVGVNLDSPEELHSQVAATAGMAPIGLRTIAENGPVSRNQLAAAIVESLFATMTVYGSEGFASVADVWRKHDCLYDRQIVVQQGNRSYRGLARGVAADGSLQLSVDGKLISLVSGEVTVRRPS